MRFYLPTIVPTIVVGLHVLGLGSDVHAAQASRFNGAWHVQMVKHAGLCDKDHRYAIMIREGDIRYLPEPGTSPMNFSGQVDGQGNVQINATPSEPTYLYPWDDEFYGPALIIGGGGGYHGGGGRGGR